MDEILKTDYIQARIFSVQNQSVMIDRDLAEMYGVSTKVLNQAVKRNISRFPDIFRFSLSNSEKLELVTNCDRFVKLKHSSINPYAFTEQGVAMLSAVLRSETAVKVSIQIMQAFVEMKKFITTNADIFQRLSSVEQKLIKNDEQFDKIFKALESGSVVPKQGIFYNGQVFDAYVLICDMVKSAKSSIVLIDNYIDETVFAMLSKRNELCSATVYTKSIGHHLKLDLDKYNQQYANVEIKHLTTAHDRFLIVDRKEVYHFGASLKDAGKKWFAFSKLDIDANDILSKLS